MGATIHTFDEYDPERPDIAPDADFEKTIFYPGGGILDIKRWDERLPAASKNQQSPHIPLKI